MSNIVTYGLDKCYYAVKQGHYIYDTPVPLMGAVSLSVSPNIKVSTAKYIGNERPIANIDNGYTGKLELAYLSSDFLCNVFGYELDSNGLLIEKKHSTNILSFALLFQTQTNNNPVRYCYYECSCVKPPFQTETTTDKNNINRDIIDLTIVPRHHDDKIRISTTSNTPQSVYDNWFNAVI